MSSENVKMIKNLIVIALLFLAVGFIYWSVNKRAATLSEGLEIVIDKMMSGRDLLTVGDVQKIIQRSFVYNLVEEKVPLSKLDVRAIERVLEDEPFVLDAEVFIDAQNQLYVHIQQREPIYRIIDVNNENYYMDKTGKQMPMSAHSTARVIVATGEIPPYTPDFKKPEKKHFLNDLNELIYKIRHDDFLHAQVEQIYVNQYKEFTLIPKVGKQKILLGKYEDIDDKLQRLKLFYEEGMSREGWNKYKTINLKYRKQIVCKKR